MGMVVKQPPSIFEGQVYDGHGLVKPLGLGRNIDKGLSGVSKLESGPLMSILEN